jgi:starch synthase
MKVLLAHPGTQHSFKLAGQLHVRELLHTLWTCFGIPGDSLMGRALQILPAPFRRKFENRVVPMLTRREVKTMPLLELKALRQLSRGIDPERVMLERNERFQKAIPIKSIEDADIVVGFDTSSWLLVERAQQVQKKFILDQSHAHPKASALAAQRLAREFPDWADNFRATLPSLLEKQEHEYDRADVIVTGSSFARQSLTENGVAPGKIRLNPHGVDLIRFRPGNNRLSDRPVRFIFVGSLSARKGVPLLLAAWKKLRMKGAELWMLGDVVPEIRRLLPDLPGLTILGKRSRAELVEILQSSDVFVLPSYFEGFGLVLLEALACGLPIITTEATAGPDLLGESHAGILIQSGNAEQLASAITYMLDHRGELPVMSRLARARAEEFSWDNYGDRWAAILNELN